MSGRCSMPTSLRHNFVVKSSQVNIRFGIYLNTPNNPLMFAMVHNLHVQSCSLTQPFLRSLLCKPYIVCSFSYPYLCIYESRSAGDAQQGGGLRSRPAQGLPQLPVRRGRQEDRQEEKHPQVRLTLTALAAVVLDPTRHCLSLSCR